MSHFLMFCGAMLLVGTIALLLGAAYRDQVAAAWQWLLWLFLRPRGRHNASFSFPVGEVAESADRMPPRVESAAAAGASPAISGTGEVPPRPGKQPWLTGAQSAVPVDDGPEPVAVGRWCDLDDPSGRYGCTLPVGHTAWTQGQHLSVHTGTGETLAAWTDEVPADAALAHPYLPARSHPYPAMTA